MESVATGVGQLVTASPRDLGPFTVLLFVFGASGAATGVGQEADDEDPHPLVRRADGRSRNVKACRLVPDPFQVRPYKLLRHVTEASNIFDNDESGLEFANNANHLRPPVSRIGSSFPLSDLQVFIREHQRAAVDEFEDAVAHP